MGFYCRIEGMGEMTQDQEDIIELQAAMIETQSRLDRIERWLGGK